MVSVSPVSEHFGFHKIREDIQEKSSTAMLAVRDNLAQYFSALRGHKLRASLTVLGLTMGVATLITFMTIVQGPSLYLEQKIANFGPTALLVAGLTVFVSKKLCTPL